MPAKTITITESEFQTAVRELAREEMECREPKKKNQKKKKENSKGKTTNTVLWILTILFVFVIAFSLGVWVFKDYYPEGIVNVVSAGYFAFLTAATAKSGFENHSKITHAAEYNNNYPDA